MSRPVTILVPCPPGTALPAGFEAHLKATTGAVPLKIVAVPGGVPALNAAIRAAAGHDIALVSTAISIETVGWLPLLQARLEADPKLGAVGAKFLDQIGLIYSCGRSIVSRFGMREHFANLGYAESDAPKYQRLAEVDAVLPWLVLFRREALDAIPSGPFDETLSAVPAQGAGRPPWLESDDLCLAIRAAGFSVAVEPAVFGIHPQANTYNMTQALQRTTEVADIDARLVNLWRKKWRWNPDYPDLNAVRERWLETPICWRIGKTLLDAWDSPEPLVDLLMVTRENLALLGPALDSLARTTYRNAHLWVHLNGSGDGSRALLESLQQKGYPFPIHLVETPVNLGLTPAINWLLQISDAPLVARLDDDIALDPDWLARMVARLRAHPYAGTVGAKVVHFDDPQTIQWAEYRLWPQGTNHQNEKDEGKYDFLSRTIANMGCCALYRRKVFAKAGGFDVGLNPVSWEDLDHQVAVWAAGYDVLFDGTITVKHPFKRLRDHCKRALGNQLGNGMKAHLKWGHGAFQVIDKGLDLAGRRID